MNAESMDQYFKIFFLRERIQQELDELSGDLSMFMR